MLVKYGLDNFFTKQVQDNSLDFLARVICSHKKNFDVITNNGMKKALIKGSSIHYNNLFENSLPKVGDFVLLDAHDDLLNDTYFIKSILERKSILRRKLIGKEMQEQILATNVDYAFVCLSTDMQFNIAKTQRIITACIDSNITPVIVLTKCDLVENPAILLETLHNNFSHLIMGVSVKNSDSINKMADLLQGGKTGILVGSSGCGKSSITNILLQREAQKVQDTSMMQDKGRHTTTARTIFTLSKGGCIIDTPGIKEFALWIEDDESIDKSFEVIANLAKHCKFSDCSHTQEKGCAILLALENNQLDADSFNNYMKLKAEEKQVEIYKNQYNKKIKEKQLSKKVKQAKINKGIFRE
jgi:ribosome biogenesis GTPase